MNHMQKYLYQKALAEGRTPILNPDHPLPRTRRQLLAQGFLGAFHFLAMPSLLTLLERKAFGQSCDSSATADQFVAPYLHFELSGGAGLAGNFAFGKQRDGAQPEWLGASSYRSLGLPDNQHPGTLAPNMEFGAPFHTNSALLRGLKSVMSPEAIAKTAAFAMAGQSTDDTPGLNSNTFNATQLAVAVSGAGANLVQIVGTEASNSGGRNRPSRVGDDPTLTKARIGQISDLQQLVDPGLVASRLSPSDAEKVARTAQLMSASKLKEFNSKRLPEQIRALVDCGYKGVESLLSEFTFDALNPANDPTMTGLFNAQSQEESRLAAMAKLMLDGNAAGGSIQRGGYDYHGANSRSAQDNLDAEAGRQIGIVLETAHRKGKPMWVTVSTDGGVASNGGNADANAQGKLRFSSDSGERGALIGFHIGANARPETDFTQIGAYNDSGAVDTSYLATSRDTTLQGMAMVYNYAVATGNIKQFEDYLQKAGEQNPFKGNERQYRVFRPKEG